MHYSERVNWKYGVNYDNVERWMNPHEVVTTLIRNPKNAKYSARIQAQVPESVRKSVATVLGWTRKNRNVARQHPVVSPRVETPRPTSRGNQVTYVIDGTTRITVPRGVSVEINL